MHILDMNDNNPNALKWIKNVKSNWNVIQKMVKEINYQNKSNVNRSKQYILVINCKLHLKNILKFALKHFFFFLRQITIIVFVVMIDMIM